MAELKVPVIPIKDNTRFGDIPSLCEVCIEAMESGKMPATTVLLFEVCDTPDWPQQPLEQSDAPERMLCVSSDPTARKAILAALDEVARREPPAGPRPRFDYTFKANTPLKQIFRKMADTPLTVLSVTPLEEEPDITFFFFRTAFTISELQKELPRHPIAE